VDANKVDRGKLYCLAVQIPLLTVEEVLYISENSVLRGQKGAEDTLSLTQENVPNIWKII